MRILDIHPHVISPDTNRYPRVPLGGNASVWSQERPATTEKMIASMDEAGVAGQAIVQASTCYGFDNSYLADTVAAHPDRFTGVFSVDVLAPDAPQKIRYWVDRKLTGLRIFTAGSTLKGQASWLDDPTSFPAWECATELGLPVCVQMKPEGRPQLETLIKRFPKTRIIVDHLMYAPTEDGAPYADAEVLFGLAQYDNIHLKLSINAVRASKKGKATPETFFPTLLEHFSADRLAWGSNFPAATGSLKDIVDESRAALSCLSQSDQEWIFGKTAEKLYPALVHTGKKGA